MEAWPYLEVHTRDAQVDERQNGLYGICDAMVCDRQNERRAHALRIQHLVRLSQRYISPVAIYIYILKLPPRGQDRSRARCANNDLATVLLGFHLWLWLNLRDFQPVVFKQRP